MINDFIQYIMFNNSLNNTLLCKREEGGGGSKKFIKLSHHKSL